MKLRIGFTYKCRLCLKLQVEKTQTHIRGNIRCYRCGGKCDVVTVGTIQKQSLIYYQWRV